MHSALARLANAAAPHAILADAFLVTWRFESRFFRPEFFFMSKRNPRLPCLSMVFLFLAGCASVEYADTEAVESAVSFSVEENMSRIYVFRDDNVVINTPISVSIDGTLVGVTGNKTYVVATVDPGTHLVTARGENTDEISVETVGGGIVFVELGVGLGVVTNRANLFEVDADRGKAAVLGTRLVN